MTTTEKKPKTQAERDAICNAVTTDERLLVVQQRKAEAATRKNLALTATLSKDSNAYKLIEETSIFFGTPIDGELDGKHRVKFSKTKDGVIKWRSNEAITGSSTNDALRILLEVLLEDSNANLLAQALKAVKESAAAQKASKTNADYLVGKLSEYRVATASIKKAEERKRAQEIAMALSTDELEMLLAERKATGNVASGLAVTA